MVPARAHLLANLPSLPLAGRQASSRGRTAYSDRSILDAIFWVRRTASPWSALPPGYPSYLTCRRREIAWSRSGLLPRILAILQDDLFQRGGIDLDRLVPDNLIAIQQRGSGLLLAVHPSLLDTWQLSTLMIFLAPPLKRTLRRRRLSIQFTPMPSSPSVGAGFMPAQVP